MVVTTFDRAVYSEAGHGGSRPYYRVGWPEMDRALVPSWPSAEAQRLILVCSAVMVSQEN